jgi:hypothetical protein
MSPDAQVKIEDRVRTDFDKYMSIAASNPFAFGIDSPRLYYKVKSMISACKPEFHRLNGNVVNVNFDGPNGNNFILVNRRHGPGCEGHNFEFFVDRSYNDLGRVAALSLVSFTGQHGSDSAVYLTSSELCRGKGNNGNGGGESVNNMHLNIVSQKNEYSVAFENYYALENRINNMGIMSDIMDDVRKHIAGNRSVDEKTLSDIVRKDEQKRGIIFNEGLENLQNDELGFQVENGGFKVWYPGVNGVSAPWCEVYFHNDYEKTDIADIEGFRGLFEKTAYNVLKKKGDIKIKLEMISRIIENKKKFDLVHPLQLY